MDGSGTQQDPYIITTWAELIANNRANSTFSEWHGGDVDLNTINPNGYSSRIVIRGSIDFKGATIRNLCFFRSGSYASPNNQCLCFDVTASTPYIRNLNLLNMYMSVKGGNFVFIRIGSNCTFTNCRFSGYFTHINGNYHTPLFFYSGTGYGGSVTFNKCAFNIRTVDFNLGNTSIYFLQRDDEGGGVAFTNCRFHVDMSQQYVLDVMYPYNKWGSFTNCKFTGRIYKPGTTIDPNLTRFSMAGSSDSNNVYLFDYGSYNIYSSALNIHQTNKKNSSDQYTLFYSGGTACTDAELGDAQHLADLGFPIAVPN